MKPCKQVFVLFLLIVVTLTAFAGERTIPVDIYILVDKSLSMEEPGKFESMHPWVRDYLAKQVLIPGDFISIYQFYGETDHLLSLTIQSDTDRQTVIDTINSIKPDGPYTDIGLALDSLKKDLDSTAPNNRYKILLLLTDLRHEAPWSSRYAGLQESYESPYLAEARVIPHDSWYEITLDMDIQDKVIRTSGELFSAILETAETSRAEETPEGTVAMENENRDSTNSDDKTVNSAKPEDDPLPVPLSVVLLSLLIIALLAVGIPAARKMKNARDNREETSENR